MSLLDKDNYYYKQTHRELKRRMRELLETCDADRAAVEDALAARDTAQKELADTREELANLKQYMRRNAVTESVRLSATSLRELSAHEVKTRHSSQK